MSSFANATKKLSEYQKQKLIAQIWKVFLNMAIVVLNDVYDFEDEDLQKFSDSMDTLADSMDMNLDDFEKLERSVREMCGVKVRGL